MSFQKFVTQYTIFVGINLVVYIDFKAAAGAHGNDFYIVFLNQNHAIKTYLRHK